MNWVTRQMGKKFIMSYFFITESRAVLNNSEARRFSGLSGNTYKEEQM